MRENYIRENAINAARTWLAPTQQKVLTKFIVRNAIGNIWDKLKTLEHVF